MVFCAQTSACMQTLDCMQVCFYQRAMLGPQQPVWQPSLQQQPQSRLHSQVTCLAEISLY